MTARTEHSVLIDAPFRVVWDMTNDVAGWPGLFTEYAAAEILRREGDTVTFRLTMRPDPDGQTWSWVSERTADEARREVRAHRVETGPFEFMDIHWTYAQEDGGVRMTWRQHFHMKPSAPVTDEQMAARLDRDSPVQLAVIKRRVEAAATAAGARQQRSAALD